MKNIPSVICLAISYLLSGVFSYFLSTFVTYRVSSLVLKTGYGMIPSYQSNIPTELITIALVVPFPTVILGRFIYYLLRRYLHLVEPFTNAKHVLLSFWIGSLTVLVFFNSFFSATYFDFQPSWFDRFMVNVPRMVPTLVVTGVMFVFCNMLIGLIDRRIKKNQPSQPVVKVDSVETKLPTSSLQLLFFISLVVTYAIVSQDRGYGGIHPFNVLLISAMVTFSIRFIYFLFRKIFGKASALSLRNHIYINFVAVFLMMLFLSISGYRFNPLNNGFILAFLTAMFSVGWNISLYIYKIINDASPKIYLPGSRKD